MSETTEDEGLAALKKQHREDGETLMKGPHLLAAARRAHTLLTQIEVDAGEYYRETAWLAASIEAEESRRAAQERVRELEAALREIDAGIFIDNGDVTSLPVYAVRGIIKRALKDNTNG